MRKKDDEKQRSIRQAVVSIILEEGFHGASISKIAKQAGVSPATVYIYYENKDAMLRDIYQGYTEHTVQYLLNRLNLEMAAEEIIAQIIRQYYFFILENREVFHFLEQFNACPALHNSCGLVPGSSELDQLLTELKRRRVLNNFSNDTLYAILFSPVKTLALRANRGSEADLRQLNELTYMVQRALLRSSY
ncbi:MAG TPA: TetR/AcrR family transcriptional regulator [Bacillota bacterium]|nr:TetR/AcrR family transcriptional regulator [Bacillota bacterium]